MLVTAGRLHEGSAFASIQEAGDLSLHKHRTNDLPTELSFECLERRRMLTQLVDLDADGDLDVLRQGIWYENTNGFGQYATNPFSEDDPEISLAVDLNGDGMRDILTSNFKWFENAELDAFTIAHDLPNVSGEVIDVVVQDVGRDGAADVIFFSKQGRFDATATLFTNDGTGRLELTEEIEYLNSDRVDVADMDGDGDLDIIASNQQLVVLHRNDGDNVFTERLLINRRDSTYEISKLDAKDVDGDNDVDLVFLERHTFVTRVTKASWQENVNGLGTDFESHELAQGNVLDLDDDVDLDVFGTAEWSFNDGTGIFGEPEIGDSGWFRHYNYIGAADLNGDNVADFVADQLNARKPFWRDGIERLLFEGQAQPLIDVMHHTIRGELPRQNRLLDFNHDEVVDFTDYQHLVEKELLTHFGDADLNRVFDSSDLVAVFQAGEYYDGIPLNSTWSEGDWNGDG
ncbi:MAG: VCBS repeat-containing protein, partial [Planctomycetales bacterium]|nr:VCBS repeat-containing protein [Planctomycetales bacterium]